MLRKFAVALLAASVFTAPVFAQGGGATATPPAKTENKSGTAVPAAATAAMPKVVTAHSHLNRYARHHVRHVKHVAHVKRVKHVKSVHAVTGAKGDKQVRHDVSKSTTGTNGAVTAPKQKGNVN